MSLSETVKKNQNEILEITGRYGAAEVWIFGSAACDKETPGSDIDVLVKLSPGRSLLDIVGIKQDLEDLLGRAVHVVTEASLSPYIRKEVMEKAVKL